MLLLKLQSELLAGSKAESGSCTATASVCREKCGPSVTEGCPNQAMGTKNTNIVLHFMIFMGQCQAFRMFSSALLPRSHYFFPNKFIMGCNAQ